MGLQQQLSSDWRTWPVGAKVQLLRRLRERNQGAARVDYSRYQADPVGFSREVLGSSRLTAGQVEILESVRDNPVTVVKSANAVGKTYIAADAGLWWVRCFSPAEVYTTSAPPVENLERLLWGEIGARLLDRPDVFADAETGYLHVRLRPNWLMVGVTIPLSGTSAQREARFSGKHSPHLLFIVDEGDAVPDEVYKGIESCMSGGHARLLVMFNPREQIGPAYRLIRAGAHVIELDAFSHPNVVDGMETIPGAVTREKTVKRIVEWSRAVSEGEEFSPDDPEWFQVPAFLDGAQAVLDDGSLSEPLIGGQWRKVTDPALSYMALARFPGQATTQLISRAWVEAAMARWEAYVVEHGERPPEDVRPIIGQDVAEYGTDRNAQCTRYGSWVAPIECWSGVDVLETGDRCAEAAYDFNASAVFVDATGVGSGTAPQAKRRIEELIEKESERRAAENDLEGWEPYDGRVEAVKVASTPTYDLEYGTFRILRDQLWWSVKEWLRTDPQAMLPRDDDLAEELCAPHYRNHNGKIEVEPKEKLRKRLKRSPDRADALCLTFAPDVEIADFGFA